MTHERFPTLSANHKRRITAGLCLLDELLCECEEIARGREYRSVLYIERNSLSPEQREEILRLIALQRELLAEIKETLGLEPEVVDLGQAIWSKTSSFWESLVETETKHLRGYGKMPPRFDEYLDPRVKALTQHLVSMSELVSGKRRKKSCPKDQPGGDADEAEEQKP